MQLTSQTLPADPRLNNHYALPYAYQWARCGELLAVVFFYYESKSPARHLDTYVIGR